MKKNSILILVFLFSIQAHETIYKKIESYAMRSLTWEDEEWPSESFSNYLNRCFKYQQNLQPFKKQKTVFTIFNDATLQQPAEQPTVLFDMITAQDINLLSGCKKEDTFVARVVDRTLTQFGKVSLYGLLSTPISDIHELQQRQLLINHFLTNQNIYTQLQECLQKIALNENILLSFYGGQDGFVQASKRCYFSVPAIKKIDHLLNSSELLLFAKSLWNHQIRMTSSALLLGAVISLPVYSTLQLLNTQLPDYVHRLGGYFQTVCPAILSACIAYFSYNKYAHTACCTLASSYSGIMFKENFDWAIDNIKLQLLMQKKLTALADTFAAFEQIYDSLKHDDYLIHHCPIATDFINQMDTLKKYKKINKLFTILKNNNFKSPASLFALQGTILVAYRLMHIIKKSFHQLFLLVGQLDSYISCATLLKKFQDERVHFCFVEYKDQQKPYISFHNFWNILINKNKVVTNSLIMGHTNKPNIILTGPNAGGKSALIKGFIINIVLAQTIGIVAADKATITPFHAIATYLNIQDDINSGNSLFKAQVIRVHELCDLTQQVKSPQRCLFALDELFNGTSVAESKAAALSIAHYLGAFPQCLTVIATHFPELTKLSEESTFSNYKVSVEIDPQGHISYPYKLEQGISNQRIAIDILREEGIQGTIIDNAYQFLSAAK